MLPRGIPYCFRGGYILFRRHKILWSLRGEAGSHATMAAALTVACAIGECHASETMSLSPLPIAFVLLSGWVCQCSFAMHLSLLDLPTVHIALRWKTGVTAAESGTISTVCHVFQYSNFCSSRTMSSLVLTGKLWYTNQNCMKRSRWHGNSWDAGGVAAYCTGKKCA
jgi:hypothetical protein